MSDRNRPLRVTSEIWDLSLEEAWTVCAFLNTSAESTEMMHDDYSWKLMKHFFNETAGIVSQPCELKEDMTDTALIERCANEFFNLCIDVCEDLASPCGITLLERSTKGLLSLPAVLYSENSEIVDRIVTAVQKVLVSLGSWNFCKGEIHGDYGICDIIVLFVGPKAPQIIRNKTRELLVDCLGNSIANLSTGPNFRAFSLGNETAICCFLTIIGTSIQQMKDKAGDASVGKERTKQTHSLGTRSEHAIKGTAETVWIAKLYQLLKESGRWRLYHPLLAAALYDVVEMLHMEHHHFSGED